MSAWLLRDSDQLPAAPDLSKVRTALAELESLFPAAVAARAQLEAQHGPISTPAKAHQIAALKSETERQIAQARLNAEAAFAGALDAADRNVGKAKRDYYASPDGQQEIAALSGFAALAAGMTADQLADRLDAALDAGLIGQARALREVASLRDYGPSARLTAATLRADRDALTPAEVVARGQAAYIDRARGLFAAYSATIPSRLDDVTTDGTDTNFVGNFRPEIVFGDAPHPLLGGDPAQQ